MPRLIGAGHGVCQPEKWAVDVIFYPLVGDRAVVMVFFLAGSLLPHDELIAISVSLMVFALAWT
jgi:hypothetical protein